MSIDSMRQDLRQFWRLGWKRPGLMLTLCVLLGVGLGACTLIFSAIDALYLRSLPFPDADRLVWLSAVDDDANQLPVSFPDYRDWRDAASSIEVMGAFAETTLTVTGRRPATSVGGEMVTASYFEVLELASEAGRFFRADEEHTPVAVLGNGLWHRRYGADPGLVGRSVTLNGASYTVVGIAPPGFAGVSGKSEAWIPIPTVARVAPHLARFDLPERRDARWHFAVGRLGDGASLAAARSEMEAVGRHLEAEYPVANEDRGVAVELLRDHLAQDVSTTLLALAGAGLLLLFVTCANAANLLLMLDLERQKVMAVCIAMGARTRRLFESRLTESVFVGLVGGCAAWLVAHLSWELLGRLLAGKLPELVEWRLDGRILLFNFALAAATGLVIGVIPALRSTRLDVVRELKDAGGAPEPRRTMKTLVVAEVGLAMVLSLGAGLLGRSFAGLQGIELGYEVDRVLSLQMTLPPGHETGQGGAVVWSQVVDAVRAVPGVEAASLTGDIFLTGGWTHGAVYPYGQEEDEILVYRHHVGPGFFDTLEVPLVAGRAFREADRAGGARVAVVSQALAARLGTPIARVPGTRIRLGEETGPDAWITVVGVVGDVRHDDLRSATGDPDVYLPFAQQPLPTKASLLARAEGTPAAIARSVPARIHQIDRDVAVFNQATLTERFAESTSDVRAAMLVFRLFALFALVVAGSGLYGVMAYSVRRRRHEIGVRLTLGAETGTIARLVLREGLWLTLLGIVAGWALAFATQRFIAQLLYAVSENDVATYLGVAGLLVALAVLATLIPAALAMRVPPAVALRSE